MNSKIFYSILKYKHGLLLGEALNVGLLFYFPLVRRFHFELGNQKRISAIYPSADSSLIKEYLNKIERKIEKLQGQFNEIVDSNSLDQFVSKNILFNDVSGISFDTSESFNSTFEKENRIIKELSGLFLIEAEDLKLGPIKKRNEEYIISEFQNILGKKSSLALDRIEKNAVITTDLVQLKFDFSWQNGYKNFVKAVSFDLENPSFIQNKALQLVGGLLQAESYTKENKARIDFLVTKPSNQELSNEYENAIRILDSYSATSHRIVKENEWPTYADLIAEEIII